ncbi:MAG: phage holin family protein [Bacteroidetes bacterium]|nr:phage holin family protein [Bacteroidota bacterium]
MTSSGGHKESQDPFDPSALDNPMGLHDENQSEARKGPASGHNESRLGAIARETRELLTDIKDWIDLRVQLLQFEVQERIEAAAQKLISLIIVAIMALFAVLFLLLAIAEAVGSWLGHPAFGYLSVGLVLTILTWIVYVSRPRFSDKSKAEKSELPGPSENLGQLTEGKQNLPETVRLEEQL